MYKTKAIRQLQYHLESLTLQLWYMSSKNRDKESSINFYTSRPLSSTKDILKPTLEWTNMRGPQKERTITHSTFCPHNCDASLSTFSANLCFANHWLPRKGWSWVSRRIFLILLWFWWWRSADPLINVLKSDISMDPSGFNKCERIDNRRG